jgi:hypothetical protein
MMFGVGKISFFRVMIVRRYKAKKIENIVVITTIRDFFFHIRFTILLISIQIS